MSIRTFDFMRVIRTRETNNFRVYDGIESFPMYVSGGGIITNRTEVNNVNYGVLLSDYYIAVKNLTATRTITLPNNADEGFTIVIKDISGLCSLYPITVDVEGSDTLDGSLTLSMNTNYMSLIFIFDGVSNYEII